ncbi:MAG: Appr-1-p processing protein, partial [Olleya sp.]
EKEVNDYINENIELKEIVTKTSAILTSFYSSFGLELLSTVDYISQTHNTTDKDYIKEKLNSWSDRKKTLFSDNRYVDISINHLKKSQLIN